MFEWSIIKKKGFIFWTLPSLSSWVMATRERAPSECNHPQVAGDASIGDRDTEHHLVIDPSEDRGDLGVADGAQNSPSFLHFPAKRGTTEHSHKGEASSEDLDGGHPLHQVSIPLSEGSKSASTNQESNVSRPAHASIDVLQGTNTNKVSGDLEGTSRPPSEGCRSYQATRSTNNTRRDSEARSRSTRSGSDWSHWDLSIMSPHRGSGRDLEGDGLIAFTGVPIANEGRGLLLFLLDKRSTNSRSTGISFSFHFFYY